MALWQMNDKTTPTKTRLNASFFFLRNFKHRHQIIEFEVSAFFVLGENLLNFRLCSYIVTA